MPKPQTSQNFKVSLTQWPHMPDTPLLASRWMYGIHSLAGQLKPPTDGSSTCPVSSLASLYTSAERVTQLSSGCSRLHLGNGNHSLGRLVSPHLLLPKVPLLHQGLLLQLGTLLSSCSEKWLTNYAGQGWPQTLDLYILLPQPPKQLDPWYAPPHLTLCIKL